MPLSFWYTLFIVLEVTLFIGVIGIMLVSHDTKRGGFSTGMSTFFLCSCVE